MSTKESIDICAKGSGRVETVTLRQNELIRNLRVLVAVPACGPLRASGPRDGISG